MAQCEGGTQCAAEGSEIQCYVVHGRDESMIDNVSHGNQKSARESYGQQQTHHGFSVVAGGSWRAFW